MAEKTTTKKPTKKLEKSGSFAVIDTGGKQYLVSEGDSIKIEKIKEPVGKDGRRAEHKVGDIISFDRVLLTDNGMTTAVGEPYLAGAKVSAEIVKISRAKKVVVIKYKAKSNYFKKRGHRQPFFELNITKVL